MFSVMLLAAGYLKADPKSASARVFAVMAIFVVFYLLNGMTGEHITPSFRLEISSWQLLLSIGTSAISGLFMIYCFLVFQERQKFPTSFLVAFAAQVLADAVLSFLNLSDETAVTSVGGELLGTGLDVLQLIFVGFAIFWTLKGWRADLVDDRRVLRWFIIGVQGALIFTVVFVENFLLDGDSAAYAGEQSAIVYVIALLALGMLLVALRFDSVSLNRSRLSSTC